MGSDGGVGDDDPRVGGVTVEGDAGRQVLRDDRVRVGGGGHRTAALANEAHGLYYLSARGALVWPLPLLT